MLAACACTAQIGPRVGADGRPYPHGCMATHLREAIALNRERMPRYAARTEGASERISRRLVATERQALLAAAYFDRRAEPYLRRGIGVVCEAFVPMALTPAYADSVDPRPGDGPEAAAVSLAPAGEVRGRVNRALRAEGFAGAARALEAEVARLAPAPRRHCMTRHLLESALRIAHVAPRHAEAAARARLPSPEDDARRLLDLHLYALDDAAELDALAAPMQARGVPILCRDVPPIAPFPELDPPAPHGA